MRVITCESERERERERKIGCDSEEESVIMRAREIV